MRLAATTMLLGLAWFAAVNLVMSAAAWGVSRAVLGRGASPSGSVLLAIRLLPSVTALAFAFAVFAPAHLRFEPAAPDERFGASVFAFAALGAGLLLRAVLRAGYVAAAVRAAGQWPARRLSPGTGEAWEVAGYSGVSLAGVFRPRILVGAGARRLLTSDELAVAIAHERAHQRSRDNLKRSLMFCAPDCFGGSAAAAALEARWRARAERDADERAVGGDGRRALHLASALLKIARPERHAGSSPPSPLWSTFNEPGLLEARIQALLAGPPGSGLRWREPSRAVLLAVVALAATAWLVHAPYDVHSLTEAFVAALP